MPLLQHLLGTLLGWLAGSVLRIRRGHVEASMRAAGIPRPGREARAMYVSLGHSAVEFVGLALRDRGAHPEVRIDDDSLVLWRSALAHGRGVVVAASHTGNWDLAACAIARELELLVVTKRLSVRWLDRFWQGTRARRGVHLTEGRGAMARGRGVLQRGGAVAMMIDQVPLDRRHAVRASFLGRDVFADRAPAALAAASRAPLVVAASRRDGDRGHVLSVLAVLEPPRRAARSWIDEATRTATAALDAFVRAYPSQWLWLHRRWKPILTARCKTPSSSPAEASIAA